MDDYSEEEQAKKNGIARHDYRSIILKAKLT